MAVNIGSMLQDCFRVKATQLATMRDESLYLKEVGKKATHPTLFFSQCPLLTIGFSIEAISNNNNNLDVNLGCNPLGDVRAHHRIVGPLIGRTPYINQA